MTEILTSVWTGKGEARNYPPDKLNKFNAPERIQEKLTMAESDGEGAVLRGKKVEKRKLSVKKKTRKTNKPGICLVSCYYDSVKRAAKVR